MVYRFLSSATNYANLGSLHVFKTDDLATNNRVHNCTSTQLSVMNLPKEALNKTAIFCDFDGTLVDIAPTPSQISVSQKKLNTLLRLQRCCDNALAFISGRPLAEIKHFIDLPHFTGAGCHGAEIEYCGVKQNLSKPDKTFSELKLKLQEFAENRQLIWEDKQFSFAVHFRLSPEVELELDQFIDQLLKPFPQFKKLYGKSVREIKPRHFDKGNAIQTLLAQPIFKNRKVYYFGDDVTDEDAFTLVNRLGGYSVKVGVGHTAARYHLDSPDAVLSFFESLMQEHN